MANANTVFSLGGGVGARALRSCVSRRLEMEVERLVPANPFASEPAPPDHGAHKDRTVVAPLDMDTWLGIVFFFAVWIVVQTRVLPRLGVPT